MSWHNMNVAIAVLAFRSNIFLDTFNILMGYAQGQVSTIYLKAKIKYS